MTKYCANIFFLAIGIITKSYVSCTQSPFKHLIDVITSLPSSRFHEETSTVYFKDNNVKL